jgi:nitrate/nitrite transporter NarK
MGVGWAIVWFGWFRDRPSQQPGITPAEITEIGSGAEPAPPTVPWAKLFRRPQLWLLMAMYWCYVWGSMFFLTWFPTYLVKGRGLTEAEMGWLAALPFLLGAVGNVLGGVCCDRLSRRFGLARARRYVGTVALFVSALFLVAVASTTGKTSGVILLALGFGVMDCMLPAAWAMCVTLGGPYAGAVSGAMNTAGQAGGFVCTVLFGYLVQRTGNYDTPIFVIAAMVMISAFLFWRIDQGKPLLEELPSAIVLPCV